MPMESIDCMENGGNLAIADLSAMSPESYIMQEDEKNTIQQIVANLPEKYRMPIYLYYSADMSVQEIAGVLQIPEGTVKSRMNKAKHMLKKELEALGYDG